MKNLFFVAFAATSIIACQKELVDGTQNDSTPKTLVTFTATTDDVDTKTMIYYESELEERSFKTRFLESDYFMVNGYKSEKLEKVDENKAGTEIIFTVPFDKGKEDGPYYAVTAAQVAEEAYFNESTHTYTLSISGTQAYRLVKSSTNTSYDYDADILAAYSDKLAMSFKHMSTFLAITIDKDNSELKDNIETVYVRQGDGGNIAGKWFLKYDENNEPYLEPNDLTSVISYKAGNVAKDGVEQGEVLIIGVPSYNYENGLLVTIKDVNGKFVSFKINDANYEEKGGVIIPFNPKFNPGSGVIKTAQDWNDFAAAVNSSKDADLYRWVGNGIVTLGADINDDEEELATITRKFPYVFDGCDHTITRNNATRSLFLEVSGEIKNLTLDGSLSLTSNGAPFVYQLDAGGKLTNCTNKMDVSFEINSTGAYVSAFAAVLPTSTYEGEEILPNVISGCINEGSISGIVDVSTSNIPVAVGAIVGDVRSVANEKCNLTIENCANNADITVTPKSGDDSSTGMTFCSVGGIAGRIRTGSATMVLNNCDNTGNITLSGEQIVSETGLKAHPICVGGIIGLGAGLSNNVLTTSGFTIKFNDCDNIGAVYNGGVNASAVEDAKDKVYAGGFAGALMGKSTAYTELIRCTNTGTVQTYDLVGENSALPGNCAVVAGFVGFGGYLNMGGCTVNCTVGNGKRPTAAWSGVIGFALRSFTLKNSSVYSSGNFQRMLANKMHRAMVAVYPLNYIKLVDGSEKRTAMNMVPDLKGTVVTDCKIGGALTTFSSTLSSDNKSEISYASGTTTLFNSEKSAENNIIAGNYTSNNVNCKVFDDDDWKNTITFWNGN